MMLFNGQAVDKIMFNGLQSEKFMFNGEIVWQLSGLPDTTSPVPPQYLMETTVTETSIEVVWMDNTESDLAGYNVYLDGVKKNTELVISALYNFTGLTVGTTYLIEVSAVDTSNNESTKSSISVTTAEATQNIPYYTNGTENVTWVNGYTTGTGSQSKNSDHFHLLAQDPSTVATRTYVTNSVDLTNINTLYIDWENIGGIDDNNYSFFIASTSQTQGHTNFNSKRENKRAFSRKIDSLDVSTLSGVYYIRAHARSQISNVKSEILIYSVWGEN